MSGHIFWGYSLKFRPYFSAKHIWQVPPINRILEWPLIKNQKFIIFCRFPIDLPSVPSFHIQNYRIHNYGSSTISVNMIHIFPIKPYITSISRGYVLWLFTRGLPLPYVTMFLWPYYITIIKSLYYQRVTLTYPYHIILFLTRGQTIFIFITL